MNRKKINKINKKCFTIIKKKKDNLHFILNNILKIFFKELIKYKNDYQQYLNYTYKNYIMHLIIYIYVYPCILLYIFKCIHAYA